MIVDERAVTALGVLQVEFPVFVPQQGVVPRQHLTVEDPVVRADFGFGQQPANLDGLVEG